MGALDTPRDPSGRCAAVRDDRVPAPSPNTIRPRLARGRRLLKLEFERAPVVLFAAATRENREGTSAEIGPNIDFYFKPLVKLKRITVFELDPSKSRLLTLRFGHRYMPETNGPT